MLENITQLQLPEILMTQKLGNPVHPKQWNLKQQIEVVKAGLTALLASKTV